MSSKTRNRQKKRQALQGNDVESQEAARQIAEVAAQVAQARNDATEPSDDEVPMLTEELGQTSEVSDAEPADAEVQFSDGPVSEEDWNEIALLVQKNVMKSMTRRTDEFVHGDLRNQLDELLDRGAERLMADIKNTLQQTISDAVSEAIAQELSQARKEVRRTENSN
jgi:hypothetical protein